METEFKIYIIITMTFVLAMFLLILIIVAPQIQDMKNIMVQKTTIMYHYKDGRVFSIKYYNRCLTEGEVKQMASDNGFYKE